MEGLTDTKDEIRRRMRAMRRALSPEERKRASKVICANLSRYCAIGPETNSINESGAVLAVYLASPDEIDLSDFIREMQRRGITVVSPRWNGATYELACLNGFSEGDLRRGPMNILEPAKAEIVMPSDVAVWIVPGLAFTRDGKRLGYGGGWYDRLLASAREDAIKIGVAHKFQILDNLPCEPHDILLNYAITDAKPI